MPKILYQNLLIRLCIFLIVVDCFIGVATPVFSLQASAIVIVIISIINFRRSINIGFWGLIFIISIVSSYLISIYSGFYEQSWICGSIRLINCLPFIENTKRILYLMIAFASFSTFAWLTLKYRYIKNDFIISSALVIVAYLYIALIFYSSPDDFYQLKNIFFNLDVDLSYDTELQLSGYLDRYPFILLDPNNSAYYIQMISTVVVVFTRRFSLINLLGFIGLVTAPIFSRSTGAILCTLLVLTFYMFDNLNVKKTIYMFSILCIFGVAFYFVYELGFFDNLEFVQRTIEKFTTGDARHEIYFEALESLNISLFGSGYTLYVNQETFKPHTDHFRILFGFGLISYISFFGFLIPRLYSIGKSWIIFLPPLIAFSINSIFDELRFLIACFVLLGTIVSFSKTTAKHQELVCKESC